MTRIDTSKFIEFIRKHKESTNHLRRSTRYYVKKLPAYEENNWFISWNWSAFFFGYVWMFYRKMYFFGFITFFITKLILGLSIISSQLLYEGFASPAILLEELDRIPLTLVWMIFLGLFSNALYFNFAEKALKESRIKRSGTSIWIAILVFLISQTINSAQLKIHKYYNTQYNLVAPRSFS